MAERSRRAKMPRERFSKKWYARIIAGSRFGSFEPDLNVDRADVKKAVFHVKQGSGRPSSSERGIGFDHTRVLRQRLHWPFERQIAGSST